MSSLRIYLISGTNRGIGSALVARILATHEDSFVYAGVRDPGRASALSNLGKKYPGRIAVVECISGDAEGNARLAKQIEQRHGYVDTVIANAGICKCFSLVSEVSQSQMKEHFHVNVIGPIALFQSVFGLLKKSSCPRFIAISSSASQFDSPLFSAPLVGSVSYGASKAALNWVTRKIHFENEWLVAFTIAPGPVDTDMLGDLYAADTDRILARQLENIFRSTETSAAELTDIIDKSTREMSGGQLINFDGTVLQW